MSEQIADLLASTREYIEANGWWRGSLVGPNGRQVCLLGGMMKVLGLHRQARETFSSLESLVAAEPQIVRARLAVQRALGGDECIEEWNDHVASGKQEVLDVLAKAEKIERAGFNPDA